MVEFALKYGPALLVVVGGAWQCTTWWISRSDAAKRAAINDLRASQRPFLEKQLEFYFEIVRITAKLATLENDDIADNGPGCEQSRTWAYRRFWELYWGELAIVESQAVARAMVAFGGQLSRSSDLREAPLTSYSLKLSDEIRKAIEESWGYALPPILPK